MLAEAKYWLSRILKKQIGRNMLSGAFRMILNAGILFVSFPIYISFLGYETYGIWVLLNVFISFAQLGSLGIDSAIVAIIAEKNIKNEIDEIKSFFFHGMLMVLITGCIVGLTFLLFSGRILTFLKISLEHRSLAEGLIPYIFSISVCYLVLQVVYGAISGLNRIEIVNLLGLLNRLISTIVTISLLFLNRGFISLVIGSFIGVVFVFCLSFIFLSKKISGFFDLSSIQIEPTYLKELLTIGGGILSANLIDMFIQPITKIIITRWIGLSSVSLYEIVYNASIQLKSFFVVITKSIVPEIRGLICTGKKESIIQAERLLKKTTFFVVCIGVCLYGLLFSFSEFLFQFWLGESYVALIATLFRVIGSSVLLSLVGVPAYFSLIAFGKTWFLVLGSLSQFVFYLGTVQILKLFYGEISLYSIGSGLCIGMGVGSSVFIIFAKTILKQIKKEAFEGNEEV